MPSKDELAKLLSESYDRELEESEKAVLETELQSDTELQAFDSLLSRLRESTLKISANNIQSNFWTEEELSQEKRQELRSAIDAEVDRFSHHEVSKTAKTSLTQQENLALASVLIGNGRMTSNELGEAIENWSAYGSISLHDHLVNENVVDLDELEHFQNLAAETVRDQFGTDTLGEQSEEIKKSVAELLGMQQESIDPPSFKIGGEYSVIRKLGGGLGSVWLARDNALDRTVAIKTIAKSSESNDSMLARFAREAKVTGRLEHPNIVSIYQFGEDETTGNLYYSMRYVGKRTLQDAIVEYHHRKADNTAQKGEFQNLLAAFLTVCQAIGFAHSKGVIHRDLKPQNVALDDFGQITVIDWGLAKFTDEKEIVNDTDDVAGQFASEKTIVGQVLGTPLYMSPEQAAGRTDSIDERTDVYGLGAILFEILTGKAPHAGRVDSSSSSSMINEILTSIVADDSPEIDPSLGIDPILARICERALTKRKFSRYSSATELYNAIQNWQGNISSRLKQKEECKAYVRDAESRLESLCEDINRNLRFLSILPPVQGIMDAAADRPGAESIDVWRERLETIIEGLLRTNREVVSISFYQVKDAADRNNGNTADEICAVQRHPNDSSFISTVPASRRMTINLNETFQGIVDTEPGDSLFQLSDQFRARRARKGKYLQAVLPTFDGGQLFGFFAISCELNSIFESHVNSLANQESAQLTVVDQAFQLIYSNSSDLNSLGPIVRKTIECEQFTSFSGQSQSSTLDTDHAFVVKFEKNNFEQEPLILYMIANIITNAE